MYCSCCHSNYYKYDKQYYIYYKNVALFLPNVINVCDKSLNCWDPVSSIHLVGGRI